MSTKARYKAMVDNKFKQTLKKLLFSYYEKNDKQHQYGHIESVCELALKINIELNLKLSDYLLTVAAYCHDMFSTVDRKNHATLAGDWVRNTDIHFLNVMTAEERNLVASAIDEHRGSYKGKYSSIYSEVLSAADRGAPKVYDIFMRTYRLTLEERDYNATSKIEHANFALQESVDMMKKKYSLTGYARYNDVYKKVFKDELLDMQTYFSYMTVKQAALLVSKRRR